MLTNVTEPTEAETTLQIDPVQAPAEPAAATEQPAAARPEAALAPRIAMALVMAALLLFGFFVYLYGLSGVSENRLQTNLYKNFAGQLALGVGPVGTAAEGAPVAVLNIPQIGLTDEIVVEGTTSRDLTSGPGHVVSSALPGQYGVSVIYGKDATFGAPFAHLMRLNRGDEITATTGQGTSTYRVESFGTNQQPAPDNTANRLVLMSAGSSTDPSFAVQVTADLVSTPQANPGNRPAPGPFDGVLARDPDSLIPALLWAQALLLASVGSTLAARYWARWPAYLCAAPVIIAITWNVYENVATLLPNVY